MLVIEYDGTNYSGWQIQKNKKSIQGELTKAIKKITGENTVIIGASRTDARVHATSQVANFKTSTKIPINKIAHAINANLPDDITVKKAIEVPLEFNAMKNVSSKTYCYSILNSEFPSALRRNYYYLIRTPLNINAMRRAAKVLIGRHDFGGFVTEASTKRNTIRTIFALNIKKRGDEIKIYVKGDGFLYKMVRCIVGTLVWVGKGKIKSGDVKYILRKKDRRLAGPNLPAKGLCLIDVKYERY